MNLESLIRKYDTATPRYTSYPTVPFWNDASLTPAVWEQQVKNAYAQRHENGISLYVHLPFCEALCTYCGCNKRITRNHGVETPYIDSLLAEWQMYKNLLGETPTLQELHLGGGTPTFFSAQNLDRLLSGLLEGSKPAPHPEFSVEVHPNVTDREQLQVLYNHGFTRLSVGVQDFDPKVQFVINRLQSFEQTAHVFQAAREIGYTSINADIIFGLPLQTPDSIRLTIDRVRELRPERIAFYSYAHVPWKSKAQRRYTEADLPSAEQKRAMYELGRDLLLQVGYIEIGMDHFALPHEALAQAAQNGTMHRNFMGYTTQETDILLGLGASSIADTGTAFMQNIKEIEEYQQAIAEGKWPITKGHSLTDEDKLIRKHILNLMCHFETNWEEESTYSPALEEAMVRLQPLEADGLVTLAPKRVRITPLGRAFLRNVCVCLDERYWKNKEHSTQPIFSKSI